MSKLTLGEAIKHCLETAEQLEERANAPYKCEDSELQGNACRECAADHRQLAEWLKELKSLRKKAEHLTEWNRKLIGYKNETICKWGESQEELQEAKRLLKAAVDDLKFESQCRNCKHHEIGLGNICKGCRGDKWEWRFADEALKLIES